MIIFALFTLSALILVTVSVSSYRRASDYAKDNSELRSTLSYITSKLRTCTSKDCVTVKKINSENVLIITCTYDGANYENCLYVKDGVLYEQLISEGDSLNFDGGNFITDINNVSVKEKQSGLFEISAKTRSGRESTAYVNLDY
jgi:hypothetical protein